MKYDDLLPISHDSLEEALRSSVPSRAAEAVLRMALHEPDWRWAEQRCLAALGDNRGEVRASAITGLGHLARIHHVVTADVVIPKLRELQDDPQLGGLAEDALEDITLFTSGSTLSS